MRDLKVEGKPVSSEDFGHDKERKDLRQGHLADAVGNNNPVPEPKNLGGELPQDVLKADGIDTNGAIFQGRENFGDIRSTRFEYE
mmetsp:Transcript_12923/g.26200  ORF Transcript_12923/g.26200 Transcript_12923/m.26200 type:complete len:85 (-) Transcript_12923:899-1153(-)